MPRHLLRRHPTAPPDSDSPPQHPQHRQRLPPIPAQSQFQTPSPRGVPPFPQLHPSPGAPIDPSTGDVAGGPPEPVRRAAAAQAALFSLFGRGVAGRPQGRESMVDLGDEEEEEEYDEDSQFEDEDGDDEGLNGVEMQGGVDLDPEGDEVGISEDEMGEMVEGDIDEEGVEGDEDEMMHDRDKSPTPLPNDLREISSLASWTVSTHKPGCGVAALRSPDHTQYWQSDGPQPHTLTLHFFKLVAVVKIRVYLDFSLDESYTPTKMMFLAGMGGNDLVEFATWEGEGPCGWVDVPLESVGGQNGGWVRKRRRRRRARKSVRPLGKRNKGKGKSAGTVFADDSLLSELEDQGQGHYDEDDHTDGREDDDDDDDDEEDDDDPYAGSVLKAMVIQMRVMENHQNGKDTHVRGFQVFARDDDRRRIGNAPSASADGRVRRHSARRSRGAHDEDGRDGHGDGDRGKVTGLEEPDWMGDPVIR
ncbi:anaphase promoting complex subunit DOC1 [Aspergillus stella-maris]|uniref:anaphase promoting complex subunit DOC1 n=1 Tax=Aspergillus stella-maris TaxID=1810926 RepID=UPI003CCD0755